MAIPINPEELLNGEIIESSRIELKENLNPDSVVHTICAFANDFDNIGGGYLFIGIKEENGMPVRPVTGLKKETLDSIQKDLIRYCRFIEPLFIPEIQVVQMDGRFVLLIRVTGGHGRPYKACAAVPKGKKESSNQNKESHEKKYYIRKGSCTVVASAQEEAELFYISSSIPFDDRPNLTAHLDDLSLERMIEHLRISGSSISELGQERTLKELAEDFQIIEGPPEDIRPKNVGILMFGKAPQKFFRYARIELVWIPNPDGMDMEEQIFQGPIQVQLKDALDSIRNRYLREKIIKNKDGSPSTRIWNYPYQAVQEILANAVYHKSYQISEPVTVRITEEEIEITSHPGFDCSISDADIQGGRIRSRIYRNRRIGDFLKELHMIEGRNTGFPNAQKALIQNGSPELKIEMDEGREYLSVIIKVHPLFSKKADITPKELEYRNEIVNLLKEKPDSMKQLAIRMGYKGITSKLSRTVNTMIFDGTLEKVLSGSRSVYRVRNDD